MFSILGSKLANCGFFINLDSSVDRLENVKSQINNFNITNLNRFPAYTDSLHQSSATKSHLGVLDYAIQNNYENIFIAEDDFQLYSNLNLGPLTISLNEYLPILEQHLIDTDWDVVLIGGNPKKPCIPMTTHLSKLFKSTGAWAYLIRQNAMKYILTNFNYYSDRLAIDDILPLLTYRGFSVYITNIQIAHHAHGFISTLQPSLGPIDYRQWIQGNYYNYIWHNILEYNNFFDSLNQIYDRSNFSRDNIIVVNNYKNINQLYNFLQINRDYNYSYLEVRGDKDHYLEYCISAEFNNLVHCQHHTNMITGLGQNYIEYTL